MPRTTATPSSRPQAAMLTTVPGRHFNLRQPLGSANIHDFGAVFGQLPVGTACIGSRARARHAIGT